MGNSHTTTIAVAGRPGSRATASAAATASVSGGRNDGGGGGVVQQGESKNGLPREEALRSVPGRIFSNVGRSAVASIYTQQGRKGINQDAMILWEDFGGSEGGGVLCGVFDGHGPHGHLVARKVRDALPLKLLSFLPKSWGGSRRVGRGCFGSGHGPTVDDPIASGVKSLSAWKDAFLRSYKATDKKLLSHPTVDCFCSGSTAVTLLKLGSNLFVGNIGDSRAVLGSKDDINGSMVAVQLTVDLKPDLPREAERIKRCRGRVFALQDEPEVSRVWLPFDDAPGLAMARAFGDFCLKDYGVISVPEFFHWTITGNDHFVVLASDGIWDVLSNQEVVDIISSSPARSSAAKLLVETAAHEWKLKYPTSKMDDCTVVCLYLDGKMETEPEPLQNSASVTSWGLEDSNNEPIEVQMCEPTLDRNFTVRSSVSNRMLAVVEEHGSHAVNDQNWSGLDGVMRVNSIVQLPRFSDEKANS